MKRFTAYILFLLFSISMGCVKKAEDIEGPTMGSLRILADESIQDIVEQEEEIFERFYPYAHLDITYTNEYDMFNQLLVDSVDLIMTTRMLTTEETDYLTKRQSAPRHFPYATSANLPGSASHQTQFPPCPECASRPMPGMGAMRQHCAVDSPRRSRWACGP